MNRRQLAAHGKISDLHSAVEVATPRGKASVPGRTKRADDGDAARAVPHPSEDVPRCSGSVDEKLQNADVGLGLRLHKIVGGSYGFGSQVGSHNPELSVAAGGVCQWGWTAARTSDGAAPGWASSFPPYAVLEESWGRPKRHPGPAAPDRDPAV